MFCSKCGKELKEGVQFCPNCGTFNAAKKNSSDDDTANVNSVLGGAASSGAVSDIKGKINAALLSLGGKRMMFIANFTLYFLSMIFIMLPLGSAQAYGYSQSYSLFDAPEVGVPVLLLFIAGLVVMCLPLFMNKRLRAMHFILPIVAETSGIVIAMAMISSAPKIAFGGVCVLIFLPITIIVTFKLTYDLRVERLTEIVTEKVMKRLNRKNGDD
jgi:hypothetical protein